MLEATRLVLQQDIGTSCHLQDEGAIVGVTPTRTRRKQEGKTFPDFYLAVFLCHPLLAESNVEYLTKEKCGLQSSAPASQSRGLEVRDNTLNTGM